MKKYILYYDFRSVHDNGHGQGWTTNKEAAV